VKKTRNIASFHRVEGFQRTGPKERSEGGSFTTDGIKVKKKCALGKRSFLNDWRKKRVVVSIQGWTGDGGGG